MKPWQMHSTIKAVLIKGVDLKLWHDLALASFIEGFISAYNGAEKKQALLDLKKIFNSDQNFPRMNFDAAMLKELRNKYINPVFDSIAAKLLQLEGQRCSYLF